MRRGRKRKLGRRTKSGRLAARAPHVSVAEVAASMPHRRGMACPEDALAESELGRLSLRGKILPHQLAAGQQYGQLWRAYMATLGGPRRGSAGDGRGLDCGGCLGMVEQELCICAQRRQRYQAANNVLPRSAQVPVRRVVLQDDPCPPIYVGLLVLGLELLARHFGLTQMSKSAYGKIRSCKTLVLPPAER